MIYLQVSLRRIRSDGTTERMASTVEMAERNDWSGGGRDWALGKGFVGNFCSASVMTKAT